MIMIIMIIYDYDTYNEKNDISRTLKPCIKFLRLRHTFKIRRSYVSKMDFYLLKIDHDF